MSDDALLGPIERSDKVLVRVHGVRPPEEGLFIAIEASAYSINSVVPPPDDVGYGHGDCRQQSWIWAAPGHQASLSTLRGENFFYKYQHHLPKFPLTSKSLHTMIRASQ